jgi:signal transduction histidine kinase
MESIDHLLSENKRLKKELQYYKALASANDTELAKSTIPFSHIEEIIEPIFDLIPNHIVIIDEFGVITVCNEQAATDLGVTKEKAKGMHIQDLLGIPKEKIMLLKALEENKEVTKREVLDKNYGIASNKIIRNNDGSIDRVIGVFQFLNYLKESEKLSLIGKIAAGIAHEVRNPLTTVRGYLQFLMETVDDSLKETFNTILIPEIDRANRIITDFLMLSKPSELKIEQVKINQFLQYFYDIIYSDALIHSTKIELDLADELEDTNVKIDRNQLLQVLLNLFRNAIEAKNKPTLKIKIKSRKRNDETTISFENDGPSIPIEKHDKVFDPFFTTKETGTGLGLSVSRKIIENHNGTLRINSDIIEKTVFEITLPISN